jgi:hypothetical protein
VKVHRTSHHFHNFLPSPLRILKFLCSICLGDGHVAGLKPLYGFNYVDGAVMAHY